MEKREKSWIEALGQFLIWTDVDVFWQEELWRHHRWLCFFCVMSCVLVQCPLPVWVNVPRQHLCQMQWGTWRDSWMFKAGFVKEAVWQWNLHVVLLHVQKLLSLTSVSSYSFSASLILITQPFYELYHQEMIEIEKHLKRRVLLLCLYGVRLLRFLCFMVCDCTINYWLYAS